MEAITRAARLGRTLGESPRQEDKLPFDIFSTLAVPLTSSIVQLWIITMSCVRILPPYGVPRAGRAAEDGDGLLGRLRGDAWLHRQLRLHLSRLDTQPPPLSYTLGRKVFHPATGSPWLHTPSQEQPPLPPSSKVPALLLFKATVHSLYNHRNVILTAHVFHRISNCSYMLSIVFCSGRILLATECEDF